MRRLIYVVGFAFPQQLNAVALINKSKHQNNNGEERPEWLAQKWNGIGTDLTEQEIEEATPFAQVMQRTFLERTGVHVDPADWRNFHQLENKEAVVVFFSTVLGPEKWAAIDGTTQEVVRKHHLMGLDQLHLVSNLKWLIPMALDKSHNFSMSLDNRYKVIEPDMPVALFRKLEAAPAEYEVSSIDAGNEWYLDAFENFRKETAAHLDPANIEKIKTVNIGPDMPVEDKVTVILQLTQRVNESATFAALIAEALGITEWQLHDMCDKASGIMAEFRIDSHMAIDKAREFLTTTLEVPATGGANANVGSSNGGARKKDEGGVQNSQQQQLPPKEPGEDAGATIMAGSGEAGTTENKEGIDTAKEADTNSQQQS